MLLGTSSKEIVSASLFGVWDKGTQPGWSRVQVVLHQPHSHFAGTLVFFRIFFPCLPDVDKSIEDGKQIDENKLVVDSQAKPLSMREMAWSRDTCQSKCLWRQMCFFFFFPLACHAPATLPCTILPCCLGCEWSWACASKLLASSEIGKRAGAGIMSWQLCKAETETLCQVRASTLCGVHRSRVYEADKSLLEVLICALAQTVVKQLLCQGATPAQVSMDSSCLSQGLQVPWGSLMRV